MYCIVDTATSLSRGFVDCPPQLLAANTPPGCVAIRAEGLEVGNYLLEEGRLISIGEPPSLQHVYRRGVGWQLQQSAGDAWTRVRRQRDDLLAATDWRVVRAQEHGLPLDPVWIAYRQALRDITLQTDPHNIIWPQTPEERE